LSIFYADLAEASKNLAPYLWAIS